MTTRRPWTRDQLLVAFALYCRIPFGVIHSRNPETVRYAAAIGRRPAALSMKMANIASLDDVIRESGRSGLRNASRADRDMWAEMNADWDAFAVESESALRAAMGAGEPSEISDDDDLSVFPEGRDRISIAKARVGHDFFRAAVRSAYDGRCCITGLAAPSLLVASHIVPWRADESNRTNPKNGLLLSALHDRAFDRGLITLDGDFRVVVSESGASDSDRFFADAVVKYAGRRIRLPEKFAPEAGFLAYHRERVFLG